MAGPKSDKLVSDAIRKAALDYYETKDENGKVKKIRYINQLARNLVKAAADGDIQAIKEVADRIDGKPHQSVSSTAEVTHNYVARIPTVAESTDEWLKQRNGTTH